jgi:Glycosyl transferase family 2
MPNLPITAILPCRNNRFELERHIDAIQDWVPLVSQVVVVDSSTDGSLDYLRERLAGSHVEFHSVPPGLYQAWNFGVSRAKSEFCYFSTVGDTISRDGLEHLLLLAQLHELDAVLSAPEMVDASGSPVETKWPIHALVDRQDQDVWLPDRVETIQWLTAFLPYTILGSSASNLYRTDLLKAYPFPTAFGHNGDAALGVQVAPFVKMALTKKTCSRFVTHGQGRDISAAEQRDVAVKFLESLNEIGESVPEGCEKAVAMSRSLLQQKISLLDWLVGLEPLAAVVKEQKGYIEILESQNATLRQERETLGKLSAGLPVPFVKVGHLLSLKRFLKTWVKTN